MNPDEASERDVAAQSYENVLAEAVQQGLYALRSSLLLDLCAYLHDSDEAGPRFFLFSPDLSEMSATEALELFSLLRERLASSGERVEELRIGSYRGVTVCTIGRRSRGLHVLGRRDEPLDVSTIDTGTRLARGLGVSHHMGEWFGRPVPAWDQPRVAVSTNESGVSSEVSISVGPDRIEGRGSGKTVPEAVASATLDATGESNVALIGAALGRIGESTSALVLIETHSGQRFVGCSLAANDDDLIASPARATLEALAARRRHESRPRSDIEDPLGQVESNRGAQA